MAVARSTLPSTQLSNPATNPRHQPRGQQLRPSPPGCAYSYSWCDFELGPPKARAYTAVLKGRGRNAVGRSDELIVDDEAVRSCAHGLEGGGVYHGLEVAPGDAAMDVVLAVPVRGAGHGSSRVAILSGLAAAG